MGVSGQRHVPAALYPRRKDPLYPLDRRLDGPQSRSGHRGLRKNPFASAGEQTSIVRSSSPWPDTILTELLGSHTISTPTYIYIYSKVGREKIGREVHAEYQENLACHFGRTCHGSLSSALDSHI
jgi:hypothetical protein